MQKSFCHQSRRPCVPKNLTFMEEQCKREKYRVAKEIKIPSLRHLGNLSSPFSPSVLHLVRDPRGMLNSMLQLEIKLRGPISKNFIASQMHYVTSCCNDNVRDFQFLLSNTPRFSYRLLRYEDLALNPVYYTQLLYERVNFPHSDDVYNWITLATAHNVSDFVNAGVMTTLRKDSKNVPFKWISQLQIHLIEEVEEKCSRMMDMAGYKPVATQLAALKAANQSYKLNHSQCIGTIDDSLKQFYLS